MPRAGRALDRLVLDDRLVAVTGSSQPVADPRAGPVAAVDGDLGTTWTTKVGAVDPSLTVRWLAPRRIDGLRIETDPDSPAAAPTRIELQWPGGDGAEVDLEDGVATFDPITVRRLRIVVLAAEPVTDLDFQARVHPVPVGISELEVDGLPFLPVRLSTEPVALPCGSGPTLRVGSRMVRTTVTASPLDLARGLPLPAEPCGSAAFTLEAGETVVDAVGTRAFDVASVVLERTGTTSPVTGSGSDPVPLTTDGPTRRALSADGTDGLVVLRENANAGWGAESSGASLAPVVVDGWQQGFVLPEADPEDTEDTEDAGTRSVEVTYEPDALYRVGMVAGALAVGLLLVVLLLTRRRWRGPVPPAVGTVRASAVVVWPVAAVVAGLVAGWAGVAVAVVAGAAAWALDRWLAEAAPMLVALPCLVATLPYLLTPWGSADGWAGNSAWPHYLALVPLVGVLVLAAEPRRTRGGRRFFRRSAGRSTSR